MKLKYKSVYRRVRLSDGIFFSETGGTSVHRLRKSAYRLVPSPFFPVRKAKKAGFKRRATAMLS